MKRSQIIPILIFLTNLLVFSSMKELKPEDLISHLTLKIGELINELEPSYSKTRVEYEYNKLRTQGDREKFNNIIFSLESVSKELSEKDGNPDSVIKIKEYLSCLSQLIREESFYSKMKEISRQTSLFSAPDTSMFITGKVSESGPDVLLNQERGKIQSDLLHYISDNALDPEKIEFIFSKSEKPVKYGDRIIFRKDSERLSYIRSGFNIPENTVLSYSSDIENYSGLSDFVEKSRNSFIKMRLKDRIIFPSTISLDKTIAFAGDSFYIIDGIFDIVFIKDIQGNLNITINLTNKNYEMYKCSYSDKTKTVTLGSIERKDIIEPDLTISYYVKSNSSELTELSRSITEKRVFFGSRPYSSSITGDIADGNFIDFMTIENLFQENRGLSDHSRKVDRKMKNRVFPDDNFTGTISLIQKEDNFMRFQLLSTDKIRSGLISKEKSGSFELFNEYLFIDTKHGDKSVASYTGNFSEINYNLIFEDEMTLPQEYDKIVNMIEFVTYPEKAGISVSSSKGIRNFNLLASVTGNLILRQIHEEEKIRVLKNFNPKINEILNRLNEYIKKIESLNDIKERDLAIITLLKNPSIRRIILNSLVNTRKSSIEFDSESF